MILDTDEVLHSKVSIDKMYKNRSINKHFVSLSEGMPKSLEAMSRGCNVVGNSVGGITELLEDYFLSNPKHYKKMLNIIIKLINDKKMSIEQSKRNFNFVNKYKSDKTNEKRREFLYIYKEECKIMKDNKNNENKFQKNN